jgi:hypothetical protein
MNKLERLLDQAEASIEQATKRASLYYKTKAVLIKEPWLDDSEIKREEAILSFQRWLDVNAQKMFPKIKPNQLMLRDGTVLKASNYDFNADHHQISIDDIKKWMESNEPNPDDI